MNKNGVPLLREFLRLWTNYKIMSKCLRGFFHYLDRGTIDRIGGSALSDMSNCCFHDLVRDGSSSCGVGSFCAWKFCIFSRIIQLFIELYSLSIIQVSKVLHQRLTNATVLLVCWADLHTSFFIDKMHFQVSRVLCFVPIVSPKYTFICLKKSPQTSNIVLS